MQKHFPTKRVIRDLSILAFMCGTFFLCTFVIGRLADEQPADGDSSFTPARVEADRLVKNMEWEDASSIFKNMTVKDPFDGYAWYRLGVSYVRCRQAIQREIELQQSHEAPANQIEPLELRRVEYDRLAIEALTKCREFLRYRGNATLQLAVVFAQRLEYEKSLDLLQEFVDEGNWIYNGIGNIPEFGVGDYSVVFDPTLVTPETGLHQFRRFWEIARQEYEQSEAGKRRYRFYEESSPSIRDHIDRFWNEHRGRRDSSENQRRSHEQVPEVDSLLPEPP